jgi:hypothetical protein
VTEAPRLDGRLDDAAWRLAPAVGAFRQVEPAQGDPALLPTTVRVLQHARGLWFGINAHETAGRAGLRVADLRREFDPGANDLVGIILARWAINGTRRRSR